MTPVPVTGIVRVGLDPFEVSVMFPLNAPLAVGVNAALKVALWPEVSVTGVVIPLRLNPVPLIRACAIVTLAPPVLVTVSESVPLPPTVTLPKLTLVGFALKAPGERPVPDTAIASDGLDPSDAIVTVPFAVPLACGANVTVNEVL